jgi:VWFA-related protein
MFFMRALLITIVAAAGLSAQEQTPVFRAGASLVRVDVQVLEGGRVVEGLAAGDFVLREEGVAREILHFGRESDPLQLMFVLDVSGSMGKLIGEMAATAREALKALAPADEVGILLFASRTRMALELTVDRRAAELTIRDALQADDLGGYTAINHALLDAANYLNSLPSFAGRRAVVILTDNGGVSRELPNERVLRELARAGAVLTAVVPENVKAPAPAAKGVAVNPDYTRHNVFFLAEQTGGETLRANSGGGRFAELLERIRARYLLSFKPADVPPGTYQRIQVDLSAAARSRMKKAMVRARPGYFTPGAADQP